MRIRWMLAAAMLMGAGGALAQPAPPRPWPGTPSPDVGTVDLAPGDIAQALSRQGIRRDLRDVQRIEPLFEHAVGAQLRALSEGQSSNSVVAQDAVEIAVGLELDAWTSVPAVSRAIQEVASRRQPVAPPPPPPPNDGWGPQRPPPDDGWSQRPPPPSQGQFLWYDYFDRVTQLAEDRSAARLFSSFGFSPVKMSWEDMDRDQDSAWGARIADVGLWGRRDADEPDSAQLMLTVRRDENFRDRVLLVPANNIKLQRRVRGRMVQQSLPQRLRELGLQSPSGRMDVNVVVSNQFSIVPVPRPEHVGTDMLAFNFSIRPYGSPTYVMASMLNGTSEVVVAGHEHQLIYFDDNGRKAPFTAARASDRMRVVSAVNELKRLGLDVDVQRFYLVQVPLRQEAPVVPGNNGRPPLENEPTLGVSKSEQPMAAQGPKSQGLEDVVLGHGPTEGRYRVGSGFEGQRAEERVRVTVSYFVTPRGPLTEKDLRVLAGKFREWDKRALWGGSFVKPEVLAPAVQ